MPGVLVGHQEEQGANRRRRAFLLRVFLNDRYRRVLPRVCQNSAPKPTLTGVQGRWRERKGEGGGSEAEPVERADF